MKLSFGAFGERRDRDWHGPVSSADMTAIGNSTRRGFTEHEHLDSVGLVHMNGRVYDPVLGRFLSSDPIEDGLGRPGGFNRYAYVKNNPLTLIDPSGLSSKEIKLPKHDAGRNGPLTEGTLVFGSGADRETTIAALGAVTISATRLFSGISVVSQFYGFGSGGATGGTGEYYRQYRGGPPAGGPDPAPGGGDKDASNAEEAEDRPIDTMLCHAGNSVAGLADTLGDGSTKLLAAGLVIAGAGFVTAQPQVAGPGLALAATGGIGNIGAGVLQFGAGLLQGAGGGGLSNSGYAALSVLTGFTLARGIVGPGTSGYRTVSQRASDAFVHGTATVAGGVQDLWTTLIDAAAPRQVRCPGGT